MGTTLAPPMPQLPAENPHRVLIVANDVCDETLCDVLEPHVRHVGDEFFVIAPALPKGRLQYWANDLEEAEREAGRKLQQTVAFLRAHGFAAAGHVGDPNPIQAIEDALHEFAADEMILATHSPDQSIWLERGEAEQARRFEVPLTHVLVKRS